MKKRFLTYMMLLASLWAYAQQISIPWTCGFEEDEAAEISEWVLNPGTPSAVDQWTIGKATRSERKQSLYISTNNGMTATYGSKRNIVMAYRLINLPEQAKEYDVSFDFREPSSKGSLYVFFDYASNLITGTDEFQLLQYASANRADGIPTRVLEKARYVTSVMPSTAASRTQVMTNQQGWRNVSIDAGEGTNYSDRFTTNTSKRQLALVFVWINRNNVDTTGIGACIDNVQIASATVAKPTNLKATYQCADSSITITWNGGLDGYMVGYRKSTAGSWRQYTYTGNTASPNHSYTVSGLKDGTYDFRVCGWKRYYDGNARKWVTDTTGYVSASNILLYCPENQCINFADLDHADCTYGDAADLTLIHEKVDFGANDVLSFHTVNTDQGAYDIRTLNKLKIIPDNAMVSVRLGNWYTPSKNKENPKNELIDTNGKPQNIYGSAVTYEFVVDSANSAILILRYAMVLEEPSGHKKVEMPYVKLTVYDEFNNVVGGMCGEQFFFCPMASDESADEQQERIKNEKWQMVAKEDFPYKAQDAGFNHSNIWWKDWSTMGLNLSEYDGRLLRVVVEARGCSQSGHYGYGYFTLGCASATIETEQCGESPTAKADAPEGFEYQWYAKSDTTLFRAGYLKDPVDGHTIVVSRSAELTVPAGDVQTYICHMSYLDSPDCFFELETVLSPRNPMAMHTYTITTEQCKNMLTLRDSSRIAIYDEHGNQVITSQECDYSQWTLRSLITGRKTSFSGTQFDYLADRGGDSVVVEHTTYISNGECDNTLIDTIIMPNILTPDSLIYDTICDNQKYAFAGKTFNRNGVYYDSLTNRFGCDSVKILYLHVKPTSMINRTDTICTTRLPYIFEGTYHGEPKRYEFSNYKSYITSDNYVIKLDNRYNCDSTINLELTIIPLLETAVDPVPVLCSDGGGFSLNYQVLQGDYDSLKITFSPSAHEAGLRDTTFYHDPYTHPVVPPSYNQLDYTYPDTVLPDKYYMYVQFYQHPCCAYWHRDSIALDIRYANSIIVQKWNDVLSLLNEDYNINHCSFTQYQWYKNDDPILGETKPYLYGNLDFGAEYKVLLTRAQDSVQQFTCPIIPEYRPLDTETYPTVAQVGSRIRSRLDEKATVIFHTLTGEVYSITALPSGEGAFTAPNIPGYYILSVIPENGEPIRQKILITP